MEAEVQYVAPGAASGPEAASDIPPLSSGSRRWVCGPPLPLFHVLRPAAAFVLFSETKAWPWAVKMVPSLDASSGRMPQSDQWERRAVLEIILQPHVDGAALTLLEGARQSPPCG